MDAPKESLGMSFSTRGFQAASSNCTALVTPTGKAGLSGVLPHAVAASITTPASRNDVFRAATIDVRLRSGRSPVRRYGNICGMGGQPSTRLREDEARGPGGDG